MPCVGAPALKFGYLNTETPSPREVKGLMLCVRSKHSYNKWEYLGVHTNLNHKTKGYL